MYLAREDPERDEGGKTWSEPTPLRLWLQDRILSLKAVVGACQDCRGGAHRGADIDKPLSEKTHQNIM